MRKNITIKTNGSYHHYRWTSTDKCFYKRSFGMFSSSCSKMGTASSLEDAIALAKAACGASKHADIDISDAR